MIPRSIAETAEVLERLVIDADIDSILYAVGFSKDMTSGMFGGGRIDGEPPGRRLWERRRPSRSAFQLPRNDVESALHIIIATPCVSLHVPHYTIEKVSIFCFAFSFFFWWI